MAELKAFNWVSLTRFKGGWTLALSDYMDHVSSWYF